jgi:thiamine pyrophosphate-dependent acetolactate synthase large subunit-like protein
LVIVGSNFPYTQFLPEFGEARAVQIDIDGRFIGMRYPTEVNLVGDAAATLRAINAELERKPDRAWFGAQIFRHARGDQVRLGASPVASSICSSRVKALPPGGRRGITVHS